MNFKHSRLSQLSRLHKAPRGTSVHAIAAPVPANSAYQKDTASQKDLPSITKHDMGKRSSQEELDRYLKSYVSSQVERVKYIPQEHITGEIPKDLQGSTLLRNGPGNFDYGPGEPNSGTTARLSHPFDGDGLLWSFAFEDGGRVFLRKKFAHTKCLRDEMGAGKLVYRGVFTVGSVDGKWQWPFDLTNLRKPSNSGVIHWAGNVLALNEGDLPFVLDTELNSKGSSTLGIWKDEQMQCAHYRVTVEADGSKRMCTFGFETNSLDFPAQILELDEAGKQVASTSYTLPEAAFGFFHDFMVTENYYIFIENPMRMDFWKFLTQFGISQTKSVVDCLRFDTNRPQKIHLVPRPGKAKDGEAVAVFDASSKFTFHQVHAWEERNGAVVLDVLGTDYHCFSLDMDNMPVSNFEHPERMTSVRRMVLQTASGKCKEYDMRDSDLLRWRNVELPSVPPPQYTCKPHEAIFAMANRDTSEATTAVQQSVLKIKLSHEMGVTTPWDPSQVEIEEYYPGDGRYCLEPYFVPKPNAEVGESFTGNDGYLIVQVNDLRQKGNEQTCLEILDASDIAAGPLATIHLQELVPPGLHGYWSEGLCLGPTEEETDKPEWENDIRFSL